MQFLRVPLWQLQGSSLSSARVMCHGRHSFVLKHFFHLPQHQRHSTVSRASFQWDWRADLCTEAGSDFWTCRCPSAEEPPLARCGSPSAKALSAPAVSSFFSCRSSSAPLQALGPEDDPAESVRLQQMCLLANGGVFVWPQPVWTPWLLSWPPPAHRSTSSDASSEAMLYN